MYIDYIYTYTYTYTYIYVYCIHIFIRQMRGLCPGPQRRRATHHHQHHHHHQQQQHHSQLKLEFKGGAISICPNTFVDLPI